MDEHADGLTHVSGSELKGEGLPPVQSFDDLLTPGQSGPGAEEWWPLWSGEQQKRYFAATSPYNSNPERTAQMLANLKKDIEWFKRFLPDSEYVMLVLHGFFLGGSGKTEANLVFHENDLQSNGGDLPDDLQKRRLPLNRLLAGIAATKPDEVLEVVNMIRQQPQINRAEILQTLANVARKEVRAYTPGNTTLDSTYIPHLPR